jgi:hypothetical protein
MRALLCVSAMHMRHNYYEEGKILPPLAVILMVCYFCIGCLWMVTLLWTLVEEAVLKQRLF